MSSLSWSSSLLLPSAPAQVSLSDRYKMVSFIAKLPETQAVEMNASSPLVAGDSSSFLGLAALFKQ